MVEKELCLLKFAPEHNYLVHDFSMPFPEYIGDINFDSIILTQTFLGARIDPSMRRHMKNTYGSFLSNNFFKIALPQDDYSCSKILDDWLTDWEVDLNYPVCVNDWETLYPRYSQVSQMKQGYTGYVSDELAEKTKYIKPIVDRDIDVAYRASSLSPVFGRLGQIKTKYGIRFEKAANESSLKLDISVRPEDTIFGNHWYDFIQNTRCMLGTNSGSSLLDPNGEIDKSIDNFIQKYPKATFEEVEAFCFPGLEGLYEFMAISPRNLECALFGTTQILAPGPYGGFMEAWKDFIPLDSDMSNFSEVMPLINNHSYLQTMANHCREKILSFQELRYSHHVSDLVDETRDNTQVTDVQRADSLPLIKRYQEESNEIAPKFWRNRRMKNKFRKTLGDAGLRRIKYWLYSMVND